MTSATPPSLSATMSDEQQQSGLAEELADAIKQYTQQIQELDSMLEQNPDQASQLSEMRVELQEALELTRTAYAEAVKCMDEHAAVPMDAVNPEGVQISHDNSCPIDNQEPTAITPVVAADNNGTQSVIAPIHMTITKQEQHSYNNGTHSAAQQEPTPMASDTEVPARTITQGPYQGGIIFPPVFSDTDSFLSSVSPRSQTPSVLMQQQPAVFPRGFSSDGWQSKASEDGRDEGFSTDQEIEEMEGIDGKTHNTDEGLQGPGEPVKADSPKVLVRTNSGIQRQSMDKGHAFAAGSWSNWWNSNKGRPAAAYGGNISAWLTNVERQLSTSNGTNGLGNSQENLPPFKVSSAGSDSSVAQRVWPPPAHGRRRKNSPPRSESSLASSWSFDSAEQLAIAAAEVEAEAQAGGEPSMPLTAAAVRAAARREKAKATRYADDELGDASVRGVSTEANTGLQRSGSSQQPAVATKVVLSPSTGAELQGELLAIPTVAEQPRGRAGRNNPRMHPSNKYYQQEPDFIKLAEQDPDLSKYLTLPTTPGGKAVYDYTSWEATRQLTATLLKIDFGIQWWLPEGQLVPTLTNRSNYIHWLQDLLNLSSPPGPVRGLDIGCGANYIYCLLGAGMCGWHMVGVDVTDVALTWAQRHIDNNPQLAHLLEVRRTHDKATKSEKQATRNGGDSPAADDSRPAEEDDAGGILTPALTSDTETFTFTMCNPPFFNDIAESNRNPNTACGGTPAEMVYPGGELAFIMRMVEDSVRLGARVHWYSTMVGKKSTLQALRKELHTRHVTAIRTTEFAQGKTSRWAIAWSYEVDPNLANVPLARPVNAQAAKAAASVKRNVSFTVKAGKLDARGLLQLLNNLLTAQGASCNIDASQWRLTAALPLTPASSSSPAEHGSEDSSMPGSVQTALIAEISRRQQKTQHGNAMVQAAKKARGAPEESAQAVVEVLSKGSGTGGATTPTLSVRVNVFQRQKNEFEISASVPNTTTAAAAQKFTQVMLNVQSDLTAMNS